MHGGIISYSIDVPLHTLFGAVGSFIIFIGIYVICLILILKISLHDICFNLKNKFMIKKSKKNNDSKELYIENNDNQEELIVPNEDKNDFIKGINNKIKIFDFLRSNEVASEVEIVDKEETVNNIKPDNVTCIKRKSCR